MPITDKAANAQTSTKSRLLLVVAAFFPDSYGGAERQALILAEALGRQGVDVTLIAPTVDKDAPLEEETPFGRIVRKRVRAYPNLGGRRLLSFISWSIWFPWRFRGASWRGVPIYVFHARLHAFGPTLASLLLQAPLLIKLGGGGEASEFDALRSKKYFYGRWVEALLRRRVSVFVANSRQIADELQALNIAADRIAEFPNGVVLPDLHLLEQALTRRDGSRLVYTGRLIPDKNVDVLYDATIGLVEAGYDINLRLIGEGSEKERLESVHKNASHRASVTFPGYVSNVYDELLEADFFVCASRREGQSNALLEAMSAGVIPIVFAASGVREVVNHEVNGFIVETSEPEAFKKAIAKACKLDREQRRTMSLAARKFVEENLGIDAIARRTMACIGR